MDSCSCQNDSCVLYDAQLTSEVSSEQVCQILGLLNRQIYSPHQVLFREGDPSTHLFLIREGQLKLTTTNVDGREQIIGLGVAGYVIGLDTMEDEIYAYTAETVGPVVACVIQQKIMMRILKQNPDIALRIIEMLNQELAQAKYLIRVLGQKGSVKRVATFILSLIPHRGNLPRDLEFPLSREEMAEMVGLRIETVSRVMANLQRKKVIEAPRGHIRILDLKRLFALSGMNTPHSEAGNNVALARLKA